MGDAVCVLAVDDQQVNLETVEIIFEYDEENIDLYTCDDPQKVLNGEADILDIEEYDVVISDYNMPGMNGLEFLEEVRERDSTMPVTIFTCSDQRTLEDDIEQNGFEAVLLPDDYLQKDYRGLVERVKSQLTVEDEYIEENAVLDGDIDNVIFPSEDCVEDISDKEDERVVEEHIKC